MSRKTISEPRFNIEWHGYGAKVYTGLSSFIFSPGFGVHFNFGYCQDKLKRVKTSKSYITLPGSSTGKFAGFELQGGFTFRISSKANRVRTS